MSKISIYDAAARALAQADPDEKARVTRDVAAVWREGALGMDAAGPPKPIGEPGRPTRPTLVPPRKLKARRLNSPEGRAAFIHAVAHIEFNAINLAWDAVYRFRGMPPGFYSDWIAVATEEAYHFTLLRDRLRRLGFDYGDFPAHDGLWEMARKTAHDVLVRMALVPRVLEARGLDVTPGMMEKLRRVGDEETVAVLEIIFRDEIGHVEIGSRWFRHACAERGLEPGPTFRALLGEHMRGRIKGPFHREARLAAGFTDEELRGLEAMDSSGLGERSVERGD